MSIPALIFAYVALLLGGLCGLGFYSEMRRRRFHPTASEDRIFRCQKCGYSYTPDPKQRGYSEETKRSASILRSNGFSYGRIAKRLGVHRTTVIKWVKTHSSGPED